MGIAYAQGAPPGGAATAGPIAFFLPLILIFLVFYFLLIRPQQKKQQQHQKLLSSLKTGDQIVTTGGLYGTVVRFSEDNRVKVRIAENVTVDIAMSAISEKIAAPIEKAKGKDDKGD